jgi:hypothetical protein
MSELQPEPTGRRGSLWPVVVVTFGLGLTATWVGLLGFGLIKLIGYAI